MNNLLIVDDETFIADGLYRLFKRQKNLALEVYCTYSAREALELLDKYRIDIVISDIQMPGMDGLEMIQKIKYHSPNCRIIILTGYSEFVYAKSAIELGADYYLLKNQGDDALIDAVKECIIKIETISNEAEWKNKTITALLKARPLLQQEFLQSLLNNTLSPQDNIQNTLIELSIPLTTEFPVQIVAARIDTSSDYSVDKSLSHYATAIDVIFNECINIKCRSMQILLEKQRYMLWLIQPQPNYDIKIIYNYVRGMLDKIQNHCNCILKVSVSFIIEPLLIEWADLSNYYQKLYYILTHQLSYNEENIICETTFFEDKKIEGTKIKELFESFTYLNRLYEQQNKPAFNKLFLELLDQMFDFSTPELQVTIYHNLCTLLLNVIMSPEKYTQYMDEFHDLSPFSTSIENWDIDLYEFFMKISDWIFESNIKENNSHYKHLIYIIHDYIEKHISEDISLTVLSEQVYLNPVYLSRVYKQITGQNISKYIADLRIQKAKEMLNRPDMKIYEIAYAVGYESPAHFSRIFKKSTGYTPLEYRDL